MIITVKILRGRECTIEASDSSSVSFVKQIVARELDIPVDRQRLVFRGKTLSDGQCLGDYDIVDGTKLHLVVRKTELEDDETQQESSSLWNELEQILVKHFTKDDASRVLENFKKELECIVQESSLDDIDRFAQTFMHNGTFQSTSSMKTVNC